MRFLFIRHAESVGNATGEYGTAVSDSLSLAGLAQADALAKDLAGQAFDEVFVSPRLRTLQTIAPYLAAERRVGEIWPELAEACWHDDREAIADDWPRQTETLPAELERLFAFRDDCPICPGYPESFGEGLRRVQIVADRFQTMSEQADGCVLVVTHGHFIRELFNMLLNTLEVEAFHHGNRHTSLLEFTPTPRLVFSDRNPRDLGVVSC